MSTAAMATAGRSIKFPFRPIHLGYLLFFLMLFVPTVYQSWKAILLALVLSLLVIRALVLRRLEIHRSIAALTILYVAVGVFFMLRGALHGAPGAVRSGTVFALWPLVYLVLVSGVRSSRDVRGLMKVLVLATLAIEIYTIDFLLYTNGWIPEWLYIDLNLGEAFGAYQGFTEFTLYSTSSLLFLVPFTFGAFFLRPARDGLPVADFWIKLSAVLGFGLALLSGRRALVVAVAAAPLLIIAFTAFLPRPMRVEVRRAAWPRILVAGLLVAGTFLGFAWAFDINVSGLAASFRSGFEFSGATASSLVRQQQFGTLIDAWQEHPWLGSGLGEVAKGPLRSVEFPWAYELSYLSLMFHVGVVGVALYAGGILWIYRQGARVIRAGGEQALFCLWTLVGTTTFLIANATNPYLEKFDYLWVIFLPVALINFWLLHGPQTNR